MNSIEEYPPIKLLEYCVQEFIPLEAWGFNSSVKLLGRYYPAPLSFQSINGETPREKIPTIIYSSEKCRVMFQLRPSGDIYSYGTDIYYGRLHAPDNYPIMNWNSEDCYCWHAIERLTIPFLDGLNPLEAINSRSGYMNALREAANAINPITQYSELTSDGRSQLQKLADDCRPIFIDTRTEYIRNPIKLHAVIWTKYGEKLFNLFDLRNDNLWSRYSKYIKECHDFSTRDSGYTPKLEKIC
jgi:hypothetical protein